MHNEYDSYGSINMPYMDRLTVFPLIHAGEFKFQLTGAEHIVFSYVGLLAGWHTFFSCMRCVLNCDYVQCTHIQFTIIIPTM